MKEWLYKNKKIAAFALSVILAIAAIVILLLCNKDKGVSPNINPATEKAQQKIGELRVKKGLIQITMMKKKKQSLGKT